MQKHVQAIIFDLGGTLIEYTGEYASWPELESPGFQAAHNYLSQQGLAMPRIDAFQNAGFGLLPRRWQMATAGVRNLTVPSLLAEVLSSLGIPAPDSPVLDAAAERYQAAVCTGAKPIAHGKEIVAQFKAQGYPLGLLSNTMFTGQAHIADLEKFELDSFFDTMLFSADANMWKPNKAPFRQVLRQLGAQPGNSIFVGDDPSVDVAGGKQAGLHTVHFLSSQRFNSPDGATPDATIYNLLELPQVVTKLEDLLARNG